MKMTTSPSDLLAALVRHGVRVYLKEGQLYMRHPWPDLTQAPPEALDLLRRLKAMRPAVKEYLHGLEAETRRNGYETRPWIPGHEIEWLWDNTRPVNPKLTPVQEYIRGRIAGSIPPPDPVPPKEPYRYTLPAGISDPLDFRWDSERQEWVHDPGWWRRLH